MARGDLRKKIMKTFIVGVGVLVLLILAGIITGIALIPVSILALFTGPFGMIFAAALGVPIGIYFLGFVFERFRPGLKRK